MFLLRSCLILCNSLICSSCNFFGGATFTPIIKSPTILDLASVNPSPRNLSLASGWVSGGTVTDFDGSEILYGKKDLKNPSLILKSKNIL